MGKGIRYELRWKTCSPASHQRTPSVLNQRLLLTQVRSFSIIKSKSRLESLFFPRKRGFMEELTEVEVVITLTVVDLLGKKSDGKKVREAVERSKKKLSSYWAAQF